MARVVSGTPVVPGTAAGLALVTDEPLSFWGGYDQVTGTIIDRRHPLVGQNARGKVLVLPASRGSSTTTAVLLEAVRNATHPVAIICQGVDRFLALASIVAGEMYEQSFPVISLGKPEFQLLRSGEMLEISMDGTVKVG